MIWEPLLTSLMPDVRECTLHCWKQLFYFIALFNFNHIRKYLKELNVFQF